MSAPLTVLVTGATGGQGGAVTQALLAKGHDVRAYVRNSESIAAQRLLEQGVKLEQGDMNDSLAVINALDGVDLFFLMGTPYENGPEEETRQGIELANAASVAGVGHLIYSSVASADQETGIPHFDSKYKVEQHLQTLDIPWSISAPVYFMDNALAPWSLDALKAGKIALAMPADRPLQQISAKNIGEFVASLAGRRDSVFGQRFDIAGDVLTGMQMAAALSAGTGGNITVESFSVSVLKDQDADMGAMYGWFDDVGYNVDLKQLHEQFSDVPWENYEVWSKRQDWSFLKDQ
jgi:uncharacterized protein YbjT (DUF2867 family)